MLACSVWSQFWLLFQLRKQSLYFTLSQSRWLSYLEVRLINHNLILLTLFLQNNKVCRPLVKRMKLFSAILGII
jgi:hypothetical protein